MTHVTLMQMINAQHSEHCPKTQRDKGFLPECIHFTKMCKCIIICASPCETKLQFDHIVQGSEQAHSKSCRKACDHKMRTRTSVPEGKHRCQKSSPKRPVPPPLLSYLGLSESSFKTQGWTKTLQTLVCDSKLFQVILKK